MVEVAARGELDRAQDAHRILAEADVRDRRWCARRALRGRRSPPTWSITSSRLDVVEQAVDREVAAARVLARRAEHVVAADQQVAALGLRRARSLRRPQLARVGAERRGLDDLRAEEDVRQAEAAADDAAVAEQALDLVRRRAGGDVEVLRLALEQEVAHAAADEVRRVIEAPQTLNDLCGVGIDLGRRYLHLRSGVPHERRGITMFSG